MNAPLRNALPHLLCLLLLCAGLAEARERQHAGGFVTGRGQAGSWQTQRSGNLADGLTRQRSVTGNDGRSASTSSTTRYDRDSGQFSRNSTTADGRGLSLEGMDKVLLVQHLSVLDLLDPAEVSKRATILPPSGDEFENVLLTDASTAATQPLIASMHVQEILKFKKTFRRKLNSETECDRS